MGLLVKSALYTQLSKIMRFHLDSVGDCPGQWMMSALVLGFRIPACTALKYFAVLCLDLHLLTQCNSFLIGLHLLLSSKAVFLLLPPKLSLSKTEICPWHSPLKSFKDFQLVLQSVAKLLSKAYKAFSDLISTLINYSGPAPTTLPPATPREHNQHGLKTHHVQLTA